MKDRGGNRKMNKKILVIDDNSTILKMLEVFFAEIEGICSDFTNSPIYGLKLFQKALDEGNAYDLIVLDILMPFLSGFDVMNIISTFDKNCKIMIISAMNINNDLFNDLEERVECFVQKPINKKIFIEFVKEILSKE